MHDDYDELLAATPPGWFVGRPAYNDQQQTWEVYAFDQNERAKNGLRKREWTAEGPTEEQCIRNMAYCLREIAAGRVPK